MVDTGPIIGVHKYLKQNESKSLLLFVLREWLLVVGVIAIIVALMIHAFVVSEGHNPPPSPVSETKNLFLVEAPIRFDFRKCAR